ncbi:slit homolog 1 protein [Hermetia illucens]|nr:slit homolog 1 protein [Hermetia illucens]XP_037916669.1 slit homolog 1 protein [Hermetia illucens]XP_037916670.1 slit homolog 1 protein [Hermetia illucens]
MKPYRILLLLSSLLVFTYADNTTQEPTTTAPPICETCTCKNDTKTLDCSNKEMKTWLTQAEWAQVNNTFEILRFDHNDFETVDVFPILNVKQLILSHNQIVKIAVGAFKNLQQLVSLDLSYNNLTSQNLRPEAFEGRYSPENYEPIPNLAELNLAHNNLHTLDQDLFEHFPALEKLILNNNVFKLIDHQTTIAISNIFDLKHLDMSYTELRDIPEYIFHAPRSLQVLDLRGNLFKTIPAALTHAINLTQLYLDENPFEDFGGDNVFPFLLNLKNLTLTEIETLKKIGKGTFSGLVALKELHIEGCLHLAEIDPQALCLPGSDGRPSYPPIEKLNLRRNNLSSLDHGLLARWDQVKLEVSQNAWDCQCENEWLIHDLYPQIRQDNEKAALEMQCATPSYLKGIPFEKVYQDKNFLRCPDANGNHPENDGKLLMGLLIGLLIGIPLAMGFVLIYKRGCFGLFGSYNYEHSRALYKRASFNEDY